MEGGAGRVSPTTSGKRRHKVLAPWRFQSAFMRREIKQVDAFDATEINCETVMCRRLSDMEGEGGSVASNRGGGGVRGDCGFDGLSGDTAAKVGNSLPKDSIFSEGIETNEVSTEHQGAAKPSDLMWSQCNGTAAERNSADKDSNSEGLGTGDDIVIGCRKGRKAVAPWRFQIEYKPKWSQGLCSGNGCNGQPETPASKDGDGLKQSAPAMPHNRSHVKVSATGNKSSMKVEKGTGSLPKKRKTDKDHCGQVTPNNRITLIREKVLTTLREFRIIYRNLLEEEESKWRERGHGLKRDVAAFNVYRERFCVDYDDQRYDGIIPGVRIGDVFSSIMELYIVGIHRAPSLPVDHINKKDGTCLAVSVVSDAQPSAINGNLDFLLHVGSTAATSDDEDDIGGTDLALKESMDTDTPVRVIHALVTGLDEDCRTKQLTMYVYGGLYLVEKFCREKTGGEQYVNNFHLRRMEDQQCLDIQEILRTRRPEPFDGIFMGDISGGLEKIPISALNSISNEYPPAFRYISKVQYPLKHQPDPPSGCDCVGGCSVSQKCACAVKNGGKFPFNDIGLIEEKPLVYECGPSCKCPPTCQNRVSQHGIKFRLQVFKTNSMGWGVRTLDFIPSGSFVCEYLGEVMENEEAQKRPNDEYLFAIGHNYYDVPRWEDFLKTIPALQGGPSEDEKIVFAVDGFHCGSLARFINHSCTPNLCPQNILHDHENKSMPHIMFFAQEDIPPLKELSYDYNYEIDEVHDFDGNKKKKPCFCRSIECTGWLY